MGRTSGVNSNAIKTAPPLPTKSAQLDSKNGLQTETSSKVHYLVLALGLAAIAGGFYLMGHYTLQNMAFFATGAGLAAWGLTLSILGSQLKTTKTLKVQPSTSSAAPAIARKALSGASTTTASSVASGNGSTAASGAGRVAARVASIEAGQSNRGASSSVAPSVDRVHSSIALGTAAAAAHARGNGHAAPGGPNIVSTIATTTTVSAAGASAPLPAGSQSQTAVPPSGTQFTFVPGSASAAGTVSTAGGTVPQSPPQALAAGARQSVIQSPVSQVSVSGGAQPPSTPSSSNAAAAAGTPLGSASPAPLARSGSRASLSGATTKSPAPETPKALAERLAKAKTTALSDEQLGVFRANPKEAAILVGKDSKLELNAKVALAKVLLAAMPDDNAKKVFLAANHFIAREILLDMPIDSSQEIPLILRALTDVKPGAFVTYVVQKVKDASGFVVFSAAEKSRKRDALIKHPGALALALTRDSNDLPTLNAAILTITGAMQQAAKETFEKAIKGHNPNVTVSTDPKPATLQRAGSTVAGTPTAAAAVAAVAQPLSPPTPNAAAGANLMSAAGGNSSTGPQAATKRS